MSYSITSRPTSNRYLGNTNYEHIEVHDLQNEDTNCQIDEIILSNHAVIFKPDTLSQAYGEEYDNCAYCLGNSSR